MKTNNLPPVTSSRESIKNQHSFNTQKGQNNKESSKDKFNQKDATDQAGLSAAQQQFILKFCRQLSSVIQACDQSESAEIEVGRRLIGKQQIKVKLSARRES